MAEQAGDQIPSLPTDRSSDVSVIKMLVNGASAADLEMANGDEVAERADMPGPPPQNEVPAMDQAQSPPPSHDTPHDYNNANQTPTQPISSDTIDVPPAPPSTLANSGALSQPPPTQAPPTTTAATTNTRALTPAAGAAATVPVLAPSAIIPPAHAHGSPTRAYINRTVTPHLLEGMKWVAANEPEKPLKWLADFLAKRSREVEHT